MGDSSGLMAVCPNCGATNVRRLGLCHVCERTVCEKCGNSQVCQGERKIMHQKCLQKDDGAFSMIKFVK